MDINRIVQRDKSLALYIQEVKPWIEEYHKTNEKYPTWDALDDQFKKKFGKAGARTWLYNLARRYNAEWLNAAHLKRNPNYCEEIGIPLHVRYESIAAVSNKSSGRRIAKAFSDDERSEIAKML